jgi:hypothetical protein
MKMTLEEIDAELLRLPASPVTDEDIKARAALTWQRFELLNARSKPMPQPCNDIVAYPPVGLGVNVLQTADGPIFAEVIHGRIGFRLKTLAHLPRSNGQAWECENTN